MSDLLKKPTPHAFGFPPIIGENPNILILGSLPGLASIQHQQYYAHPQNSFWRILEALFQIDATTPYMERCEQVKSARLAIWDVCHSAERPGSLDSAIDRQSVVANEINRLLVQHPSITLIAFNGNAAATLFKKHTQLERKVNTITLPSTSPANAGIPYAQKLEKWSELLQPALPVK